MGDRTLKIPKSIVDLIRSLHPEMKRKLRAALEEILEDADCGKALKDDLSGYRSLRVSRYRIVYRPDHAGSEIVAIGPRRTIYEEVATHAAADRRKT